MGRVSESLHKALVPINSRAVISHILDLVPPEFDIIIALGHRADQVTDYLRLAHPQRHITSVYVRGWGEPGGGPGASLLACHDAVKDSGGDLFFTSCDTLWMRDERLWRIDESWMGVASMPFGTQPSRWCRVDSSTLYVGYGGILDKTPVRPEVTTTYVGLGHVTQEDLMVFWDGLRGTTLRAGEQQVSNGFINLVGKRVNVRAVNIDWMDVGDEEAYHQAVLRQTGYDWTKTGQATYVLPNEGRVVKFFDDPELIMRRVIRSGIKGVPKLRDHTDTMLAYDYIPGVTAYTPLESLNHGLCEEICEWYVECFTERVDVPLDEARECAMRFYRDKTLARVGMLSPLLKMQATEAISRIDWEHLVLGVEPVRWHGDLNFGNIIVATNGDLYGIDWREDFDGAIEWGDARYDVAKLVAGTVVHWQNAQRGDMRPWPIGYEYAEVIMNHLGDWNTDVIGALTLINSAPLHAPPLDDVLVARGCAWLEKALT
jgi:hypothetical protein